MTSPFGNRPGSLQSRDTEIRLRRALCPHSRAPSVAPARRAKSPRPRQSERERRRAGSSENREVNQAHDAQAEKEGVTLQVSDLEQTEDRPETPGGGARAANGGAVE